MHKLAPVEDAKTLFHQAKDWSVWRWLMEKKTVRRTADAAWEALEACEEKVRAGWSADWQAVYRDLSENGKTRSRRLDAQVKEALAMLHETDLEARQARDAAEDQFDEADRRMSTRMAREGAQMAIDAWEMREKIIRKMEALARKL